MNGRSGQSRRPSRRARCRSGPSAAARARVLVVDDDERNLLAHPHSARGPRRGRQVAASGEEALRQLLKGEFAVILLDVYMPGMDGYETAQIIREREQTKRIPIVFLSAVNKETEHLMRGYSMGAVDYVFKPVDPVVLRSKVAVFVDLFAMRQRDRSARPRRSRRCSTPTCAPMPSGCGSSRSCASPSSGRRRSSSRCRSCSISRRSTTRRASPQFVGGDFAAITGFDVRARSRRSPACGRDRLHPDDRERVADGARRPARSRRDGGRISLALRRRPVQAFPRPGGAARAEPTATPLEYAGTLLDVTDRKAARGAARPGAQDGRDRQADRRHRARFQQSARRGARRARPDRAPRCRSTSEQRKIVGMTRHAAEQGAELVRRLLAFARRQQLAARPRSTSASCRDAVTDLLAPHAGRAGPARMADRRRAIWRAYRRPAPSSSSR